MSPRKISMVVWWLLALLCIFIFLYPSYATGVSAADKAPILILLLLGCYLLHRLTIWVFLARENIRP
jgi:hypothetical protein